MEKLVLLHLLQAPKSFAGRNVLVDLTLSLYAKETVAIVGPNGSGKSTLLRIISGISPLTRGSRDLAPDLIHRTTNVVLDYARRERDHRGFVDDKGWAHAAAHTADALDSCAQHPVTTLEERVAILNDDLHTWLSRFDIETTASKESAIRWVNAQHFLRSLYFLMYWEQPNHPLLVDIGSQLKKLNVYYRYGILQMGKKSNT